MISIVYLVLMLLTAGNLIYLAQKKYKHVDRYLWTLVIIIPIINMGYWLKSTVHTPEAGMIAFCFLYLCNTIAPILCMFLVLQSLGIRVSKISKIAVYGISTAHLMSIWLSKDTTLYYATLEIKESYLGSATITTPGLLKVTHYIFLVLVMLGIVISIIYGIINMKGMYSLKTMRIYIIFVILGIVIYSLEIIVNTDFSFLPLLYTLGSFVITYMYDNFQSHDLINLIGEKQLETGLRGYAAFDTKLRILSYNTLFAEMIPEIIAVGIDEQIGFESDALIGKLYPAIDLFVDKNIETQNIAIDKKIYCLTVSAFTVSDQKKANGYLIEIRDITEETERKEIVDKYYDKLSKEVKEKTKHIADIQNTVVLGLANMVENRDDNTGGHVKRTSDVIKVLVDEIIRRKTYDISDEKASDIIRSAPMHDLGKIAIDNSILCKPSKLTDEEYASMKTHAPKSGEIVKIILEGVEEQHFVNTAFNVARYHHERWDGKGYPDQLLGEKIPVEARIMAVADVYDALVSERCYKKAMSFDKAFDIMNECMGSQFDPAMRPVFISCRTKLEEYYAKANQQTFENSNSPGNSLARRKIE